MSSRFLRACWREPVDATPVWFMRQAGRYMPGYRAIRREHAVLDIARSPELSSRVALEPVRTLGVDAAILFADIVLPLQAMEFPVAIEADVGPVSSRPVRSAQDVADLRPFDPARLAFLREVIGTLKQALGPLPLIGFCAAPFTLASYMIEGRPSRDLAVTKSFMLREPEAWAELLRRLADAMAEYLRMQAAAGVDALQVFDTWAGALDPRTYEDRVLPASHRLFSGISETGLPSIHFGTATGELLPLMRRAGGDVLSVDWRLPIGAAWQRAGEGVAIQGNLDPAVLLATPEEVRLQTSAVLEEAGGRAGHIFNLGHGVLPGTPVEHASLVVERVHALTAGGA